MNTPAAATLNNGTDTLAKACIALGFATGVGLVGYIFYKKCNKPKPHPKTPEKAKPIEEKEIIEAKRDPFLMQ